MNKSVNGVIVKCSPEEEAEILAEWAATDAKAAGDAVIEAKEEKRAIALKANEDFLLSQTAKLPDAPQAVKDYISNKEASNANR